MRTYKKTCGRAKSHEGSKKEDGKSIVKKNERAPPGVKFRKSRNNLHTKGPAQKAKSAPGGEGKIPAGVRPDPLTSTRI